MPAHPRTRRLQSGIAVLGMAVGAVLVSGRMGLADDEPAGPRAADWQRVQQAFDEGRPKTALDALAGVEDAAMKDRAWAEVARAIASRILAETGDRPPDDPERVIRLAAAIAQAPPEARGVLEAIRANWTWGYFQMNRWRYQQRTRGGADGEDLTTIAEWDLPAIVSEIRSRFAAALGAPGSPERAAVQSLPVAAWSAIIEPGSMPDSWRPTVWDVIARDALDFAVSGERGLVMPEDAFELDAESPALGTLEEFLAWKPEADATDTDSPLVDAAGLYRDLLEFHRGDADRSALLAADLDRILWASNAAVGADRVERKRAALESFLDRAGDHETAAVARFHLAQLVREEGDLVEARAIAVVAAEQHPNSTGGRMCRNLVAEIEGRDLTLATERNWAAPWPVIRVTYRNLTTVFLRLARADFAGRLGAGKPHAGWIDEADRAAILALPAVKTHVAELPATPDYRTARHDVPVATAFAAETLEPGDYWVIASHREDFGARDNVVSLTMIRVTRLAIVTEQAHQVFARRLPAPAGGDARAVMRPRADHGGTAPLAGHVVDIATGEPVSGAAVQVFVRGQQGNPPPFAAGPTATTDADGRFDVTCEQGRELVVVATATLAGTQHRAATDPTNVWRNVADTRSESIVLVTDRGIHRPGQIVFYKGIVSAGDHERGEYAAVAGREVVVAFRDANGREVAQATHTTNANGSFHGNFPIPGGALPGQWAILATAGEAQGGVGVRVEEYKRPKFQVTLAAPETSAPLGGMVVLTGTATTYTGLPVADATVRWRVERQVRWPIWCRCFFPWLPFGGDAQRIARGTARTDASGRFTVTFPARPDRAVPKESLPVFTFRVTSDVTDAGGETRTGERSVSAGYTDVEAALTARPWQATRGGGPTPVEITLATTTLDGMPRGVAGTLSVSRLVQPADVARGDLFNARPFPAPRPRGGRHVRGGRGRPGGAIPRPHPDPIEPDPADPETWAAEAAVATEAVTTDMRTGRATVKPNLAPGIYRAVFEIPARGDVPAVKAQQLVEVIDPDARAYGVKRAFALFTEQESVEPGTEFRAVVGTGYATGRALVEISQAGEVLERWWTDATRTQWPVSLKVTEAQRGGFTMRTWLVRDGRLHVESRTIDVPWTDKKLTVAWERFSRRVEPGTKEVWRARLTSALPPAESQGAGASPVAAEFLALAYDQSLDALAPHEWPGDGLLGLFRREASWTHLGFTNAAADMPHVLGHFDVPSVDVPPLSFRRLRDPFGSPQGGMFGDGMVAAMAVPTEMAPPGMPRMLAKRGANMMQADVDFEDRTAAQAKPSGTASPPPAATAPPPRKNLVETAFFLPVLTSGSDGIVTIEFTLPDTLTTWHVKGLAHDARLRSGTLVDMAIAAKDLMVEPLVPRFLREGDVVRIPVKVSNTSTGRLTGTVTFALADARTNDSRDGLVEGPRTLPFDLAAGESKPVVFSVRVADGTDALRYLAVGTTTGSARPASDGEEALLAVLPRRVLVTETVPITIRGPGERTVSLDRLARSAGTDIESQSLVVQAASNPAWYAVLALPSIMEDADESTETLFTRLYANSLARHLATRDPRIARVCEQWKGTEALASPLEKNTGLVTTLLAETPWVRDAVDEREARARLALLFDATRAANEMAAALACLESLRHGDGGWPWFPGGATCDPVTLGIVAGFGRLRAAGVDVDVRPAVQALPWLDGRLVEERKRADGIEEPVLTPIGAYALYARSFFTQDAPPEGEAAAAIRWGLDVGRARWMKITDRRSQGHLALALARAGDRETALAICDSLKQRAVDADVAPGRERESWQGMWWRDPHPGWWNWAHAPIATQAIMVECFDEVAGDRDAVEALKVWLLSQKRTSRWPGSRATADAVGALLGHGDDLLGSQELVTVTVGQETIGPEAVEAGTGFFETRFVRREIEPALATVTMKKADAGLAWGGVHWQYLDDIANVPAAGREELAIEKRLFVKRFTKAGPELVPAREGEATRVAVGDELVVRLVVTSDRDYEFLELADHRPSLTEPLDVLSGWRLGDGAAWYVAIRDTSTRLFFERLPRGTHVFEYALRATHRGTASSGFATLQSRYAPEFSARSASVAVEVE